MERRLRVALGLEYDGQDFEGWQIQPHGRSVQNVLEQALSQVAGEPIATVCAGRTDTGVHASLQVVHFDTASKRPLSAWVRGVNAHLPPSIAVLWAKDVSEEFHARFSAVARAYRYVLLNAPVRPALLHGRVGWFHLPLNLQAMQQAAQRLIGEHDFSAFRSSQCQAKSPIRRLDIISVQQHGQWFVFEFEGPGFLHHMVRNIVGTLVYVGKGKHPPEWVAEVLAAGDRKYAAPTFSPAGLYLSGVTYPSRWDLPGTGRMTVCGW